MNSLKVYFLNDTELIYLHAVNGFKYFCFRTYINDFKYCYLMVVFINSLTVSIINSSL